MLKFLQSLLDFFIPMGVKFGEVDSDQIIDNEYRSKFIEKLLEWLFANNPELKRPSSQDVEKIQIEIIGELQKKYPNSGIKLIK